MSTKSQESLGVIQSIPAAALHPHPDNPYGIRDDPAMQELTESIRQFGILVPAIARQKEDGSYELISGHRRREAALKAGLDSVPVVVLKLDDDEAIILLVDSNIQRENILPSERAKAYKLKMEAVKRKAGRPPKTIDNNSPQHAANFRSDDEVAKADQVSGDTVRRYIRLTELVPEIQQMVDEKKMAVTPAVEISYLQPEEQKLLLTTIESEQATPSLSQAQRIRKLSQSGELNEDNMLSIMMEQKKPERNDITLSGEKLRKYFPRSYSPMRMEETIFKLLDAWLKKRQRDHIR